MVLSLPRTMAVYKPGVSHCLNGGFAIVGRGKAGRFDLGLLSVFPIVVKGDLRSVGVVQFEGRIEQWIGNAERGLAMVRSLARRPWCWCHRRR